MKKIGYFFVLLVCVFVPARLVAGWAFFQASTPSALCSTLPGLSCDVNGWTQFSPTGSWCEGQVGSTPSCNPASTDTQIIYVAAAGTDSTTCGTFSSPCGTPNYVVKNILRNGSPDWMLMKCGDTWTSQGVGFINKGGRGTGKPWVLSSYDGGAAHNPPTPDPVTCSARPLMLLDQLFADHVGFSTIGGGPGPSNYVALVGLDFYCYRRDPSNVSFLLVGEADHQLGGIGTLNATTDFLFEDNRTRFCNENGISDPTSYSPISNLFVRRNQFINSYPFSTADAQGLIVGSIANGPSGYVLQGNLWDHDGWNTDGGITWAAPSGFNHSVYLQDYQANGADLNALTTIFNFTGNVVANGPSGEQFRVGGLVNSNSFIQEAFSVSGTNEIAGTNPSWSNNVVLASLPTVASGVTGFGVAGRSVNGGTISWASSPFAILNNFLVNSPGSGSANGIQLGGNNHSPQGGSTAATLTGNVVYNFGISSPSNAITTVDGGMLTQHVSAAGSSYTDNALSITSAAASGGQTAGQNYIEVTVSSTVSTQNIGSQSLCYYKITGQTQAEGPFVCSVDSAASKTIIIFGTNFSAALPAANGGATFTGTLYFPWYNVRLSDAGVVGHYHCTVAPGAEIISIGGSIAYVGIQGSDNGWSGEVSDDPGANCAANDVLTAAPGATCSNNNSNDANCAHGFSYNGTTTTGSGLQITLDTVTANTVSASGCTLASNNLVDPTGINTLGCSAGVYVDPNRTAGSYFSTLAGSTANCTFTASVSAGTMTVSANNGCALSIGDAITWSGQTKADFIKGNSTTNPTLCSPNCTGTGSNNGTYALAGGQTVGSTTISDWTAQQLLNAMHNQTKSNWKTTLTACALNTYIKAGFGATDGCVP